VGPGTLGAFAGPVRANPNCWSRRLVRTRPARTTGSGWTSRKFELYFDVW